MHPGFMHWWAHREAQCGSHSDHVGEHGAHGHHGHGRHGFWAHAHGHGGHGGGGGDEGFGFGVRRPLRFLAWKLELEDAQVEKLARILDELKIERAQGAVDARRSTAALADAVEPDTLDAAALDKAAKVRVESAERLARAVTTALGKIHELLTPKQRGQLAYLLRTGTLSM